MEDDKKKKRNKKKKNKQNKRADEAIAAGATTSVDDNHIGDGDIAQINGGSDADELQPSHQINVVGNGDDSGVENKSQTNEVCVDEFNHQNVDVACNLLETCGRFLYRSPETTFRMTNMLDILMRLKNVKNLDPRQSTLVGNVYYLCKPPERPARISKVHPPLHQYIRQLVFSDLDKDSIANVLKQLRK